MDLEKVKAILDCPSPSSIFEVRSFHGLASFYRKCIRNFNAICAPIIETIKKDKQPFHWKIAIEKSFHLLKKKITEKLVLKLPNFNQVFQLKCDASGIVIRAILIQEDKPIDFFNKKFHKERKSIPLMTRNFM